MPGKMLLRSAGRAPTPTVDTTSRTVNARPVRAGAKRLPVQKKKTKVAARPTADERRITTATNKLIRNAQYQTEYEKRGNPGVFDPFQPISDHEWKQEFAAMQPSPSAAAHPYNNVNTSNGESGSRQQKKRKAKEPPTQAVRASKRKATEPTSEAASQQKKRKTQEPPKEPVRASKRNAAQRAEKRPREDDNEEPNEAPTKKKKKSVRFAASISSSSRQNAGQNNSSNTAAPSSLSTPNDAIHNSAGNPIVISDAAPQNSANNPIIIPDASASSPPPKALRDRSDPVVGKNGFRLLHPQHRFVRGIDQTEHLTIRYVDNSQPGVTQTHIYAGRTHKGQAPPEEIDWNSAEHMAKLNRWMCQFLKRSGAASLRADVVWFTQEERDWLRDLGRSMADDVEQNGGSVLPREEQARLFNERWAGTRVTTGRQAGRERPVRSATSLESEIYRSKLYPESLRRTRR